MIQKISIIVPKILWCKISKLIRLTIVLFFSKGNVWKRKTRQIEILHNRIDTIIINLKIAVLSSKYFYVTLIYTDKSDARDLVYNFYTDFLR